MFDVLVVGGGVSGVSCALILGSAHKKPFAQDKKLQLLPIKKRLHYKMLFFFNAYGVPSGKLGSDILTESTQHLKDDYPHIQQIEDEKVMKVTLQEGVYKVETNKQIYTSKIVVIGIGSSNLFAIEGLMEFVEPHQKSLPEKQRIQLRNNDHKVADNLYVCGTLAGHRSQLAIASGSGAAVATDILVLWNSGIETHSHDSVRVK